MSTLETTESTRAAGRIALGTAQFGLDYGISNSAGKVSLGEAGRILEAASAAGVDTLDTAIDYGTSEACLGELGVANWRIISKLPSIPQGTRNVEDWVLEAVSSSLKRLRVPALYGLLLHRPEDLLGDSGEDLARAILRLKADGLTRKIGLSVYSPLFLEVLRARIPADIVQAPFNVLDRRLVTTGWSKILESEGVEIHTRSAFLQGLLLMSSENRPARFDPWSEVWNVWHSWLESEQISPVGAALGFALGQEQTSRVVVGVDTVAQMNEILGEVGGPFPHPPESLSVEDEGLIDPSQWSSV